ncbi:MAG: hypothetical protein Q4A49_04280 [Neisseria sp.]|nr:hypothetical protein [Neisseria sp.]
MFIVLLTATFLLALLVSLVAVKLFSSPADGILQRIINDQISKAWLRYLQFAVVVVGISSGVRMYDLEKYISPLYQADAEHKILELTWERWVLEVYRTVIETLQGIAWAMLVFFMFALVAYVVVRIGEMRRKIQ